MIEVNTWELDFSMADKNFAQKSGKPLYLVVPERDIVKVYRHPENCPTCEWVVERL